MRVGFHGYIHEAPNSLSRERGALLDQPQHRCDQEAYGQAAARGAIAAVQFLDQTRRTSWSRKGSSTTPR